MLRTDWLPTKREEHLKMAKNWLTLMKAKGKLLWKMDDECIDDFEEAILLADVEDSRPKKDRTAGTNVRLKETFDSLISKMRYIKRYYFINPPVSNEDLINLWLRPKDVTPTPVGKPEGKALAKITYTASGSLQINIKHIDESASSSKTNYGFRIYYGIFSPADTPPDSGKYLRESRFSRKMKHIFNFEPEDRGKTAYFSIRCENSKGEAGVWGDLVSSIIP